MAGNPSYDNGNEAIPVGFDQLAREYDMNHKRRGKACIFHHYEYKDKNIRKREGNKKDVQRLTDELQQLGFEVVPHEDRTVDGIKRELHAVAKEDHTDDDCIVIVVMSHGKESSDDEDANEEEDENRDGNKRRRKPQTRKSRIVNQRIFAWDKTFSEVDLFEPFNGRDCKTLRGKPKLFFIQACRGDKVQTRSQVRPSARYQADGSPPSKSYQYWIPDTADFLVARATMDGCVSFRNEKNGTPFIQALCDVLKWNRETGMGNDLNTMLSFVNGTVVARKEGQQMPFVAHSLTRLIYFRPKACTKEEMDEN